MHAMSVLRIKTITNKYKLISAIFVDKFIGASFLSLFQWWLTFPVPRNNRIKCSWFAHFCVSVFVMQFPYSILSIASTDDRSTYAFHWISSQPCQLDLSWLEFYNNRYINGIQCIPSLQLRVWQLICVCKIVWQASASLPKGNYKWNVIIQYPINLDK